MPLSDRAGEGYQNKILQVLAKAMGARLTYYWRSYTGNIVGQAFGQSDECDILLDMPTNYQDTPVDGSDLPHDLRLRLAE